MTELNIKDIVYISNSSIYQSALEKGSRKDCIWQMCETLQNQDMVHIEVPINRIVHIEARGLAAW